MIHRGEFNIISWGVSSHKEVKQQLERMRTRVKKALIRGVIGEAKRRLESLKTKSYSVIDWLLTEDFSDFDTSNQLNSYLEKLHTEKDKLLRLYERALEPYPEEIKKKLEQIEQKAKLGKIRDRVYISPYVKEKLNNSDKMPLIRYLQSKVRAQQLLHHGLSGILMVREYILDNITHLYHRLKTKFRMEERANRDLESQIKHLRKQIRKDGKILSTLVKMKKEEEKDTYLFNDEDGNWREEKF